MEGNEEDDMVEMTLNKIELGGTGLVFEAAKSGVGSMYLVVCSRS